MRVLLALVAALVFAPTASAKPPVIGIGEQHPQIFTDPAFQPLGIHNVRYIASYDALENETERAELDAYLRAAGAANMRVLLGFGHSRDPLKAHTAPSVKRFEREFVKFRQRYPWITDYLTWNEANHCSQPTCNNPKLAARYYLALRKHCEGCRIVAADLLDGSKLPQWAKAFQKAVGNRRVIWGLHNYIDANRFRTRGTKALLRTVKGEVWFTETGGIVKRVNPNKVKLPESTRHAAEATRYVFKLAALSKRVTRVYFYHWSPAPTPNPTWDSAFVDKHDRPRPAYEVLYAWLVKHGIAS
ncbi:glycosyl hydrolase [Solirubrobacter soli]|uniref:glycosyl hydrolase n=1 Tax=Solirubrobacter soli TaxID=363832 RepID=UPI000421FDFE|nr:glycosyl hydrolase [Solirubrobacter soli]